MRRKKAGAIAAGAFMAAMLLAPVWAGGMIPQSFWISQDGAPVVLIVVGDDAAASDIVSASLIAAKVGTMAVRVEEKYSSSATYQDTASDIPLAYRIPSWEDTIPFMRYNIPGGPAEEPIPYYKTWGITTHWTPNDNAYVVHEYTQIDRDGDGVIDDPLEVGMFKFFNEVRVEYTLGSLFFFDEDSRAWFYTHPDGIFQAWETHEEIQIRFDDLYLTGGKEFRLSGYHFQDHIADLAGGDVNPSRVFPLTPTFTPDIPGLIYRIDNIRRPRQLEVSGYSLSFPLYEGVWVDTHAEGANVFYMPEPYAIGRKMMPRIHVFGKEHKVVDATFLWDYDLSHKMQDADWELGDGYIIITGEPRFYGEQYLYEDSPQNFDGYEILVRDVDRDHNKIFLSITTPPGDNVELWMILDPLHGFSSTPPLMSQTGEVTEYNGWSKSDVFFRTQRITYRDEAGYAHYQYAYPLFAIDGISAFVGAGGTVGGSFNIYTLSDAVEFRTHPCCMPYVDEPQDYQLFIDQQMTLDPCVGNYFSPVFITLHAQSGDVPSGKGPLGDDIPGTARDLSYTGPWHSIDSHCTTTFPLPSGSSEAHDVYSYTHFMESIPDIVVNGGELGEGYADRDPNDYLWLYEDGFDARKNSHMWIPAHGGDTPGPGSAFSFISGGDYPLEPIMGSLGADYMWEMNFALCETLEVATCVTKYVVNGPHRYFRIEMGDVTWDDDGDGSSDTQADDGINFSVVMEVSSGTYTQMTSFPFDPQSIVKLAGDVTDADVAYSNLVLIGGPVANILVCRLVDAGREPDDGSDRSWMAVFGDFKLYSNGFGGGRDVLVVAGPDREETRKAAEELVSGMS